MKNAIMSMATDPAIAIPIITAVDKPLRSRPPLSLSSTSSEGTNGTTVKVVVTAQIVSNMSVVLSAAGRTALPFMMAARRSRMAASSP